MQPRSGIKSVISETENKYLKTLYEYVRELFTRNPLPSHDHKHHLRIWYYASNLINSLASRNICPDRRQTENLILAVFFHDTGLTRTLKKEHGCDSRKICEQFLNQNPGLFDHYPGEGLDAIRMHDDKEYAGNVNQTGMPSVLNILSVCDDFDAFGAVGVLRYAEIYLLRNISLEMLPSQVIDNLKKRYRNFVSQAWIPPNVVNRQEERYQFTMDFYRKMQLIEESGHSTVNNQIISGYMDSVYTAKTDIEGFIRSLDNQGNDDLSEFSKVLKNDLHPFFINLPE